MKTILLVDDLDTTRDAYAVLLQWAGYDVLTAANGKEACDVARTRRPDLVVMDLNMPVLTGWEAARALKRDARTAGIPLIAVSAGILGAADRRRIGDCGFSAVWSKPLPPRRLLEAIQERIGQGTQAA